MEALAQSDQSSQRALRYHGIFANTARQAANLHRPLYQFVLLSELLTKQLEQDQNQTPYRYQPSRRSLERDISSLQNQQGC